MEERDGVDNLDIAAKIVADYKNRKGNLFADAIHVVEDHLKSKGETVATMESITSGIVATLLTAPPGASAYLKYSWVTYSNEAKIAAGVPAEIVEKFGVYSPQCARAMAEAAMLKAGSTYGIGVTGVAGPGASDGVPPGSVWYSICSRERRQTTKIVYPGDRVTVRTAGGMGGVILFAKFLLPT